MDVPVTVVVDGSIVVGSTAARLHDGVVVAPLDPYVRSFATRIRREPGGTIVVERSGAVVTLSLRARDVRVGTTTRHLTLAPDLHTDRTIVPLATIARDLGATATYDGPTHTITVVLPASALGTPEPFVAGTPGSEPFPTFAPPATPQATPTLGAMPRPRRTPIEIDPPRGTSRRSWEEARHG